MVIALLVAVAGVAPLAGCASSVLPAGALFSGGEHDSVCGAASRYADAVVSQPIEVARGGPVKIVAVAMGHASNVRVGRLGVAPLHDYFLLGRAHGTGAPDWSGYSKTLTVAPTHPGLASAELKVIDRGQDASAGPFIVTYEIGQYRYRTEAALSYRIPKSNCH